MIIDRVRPPFPVSIFHLRTSATIARKGNCRTKKANRHHFWRWKSNFVGISIIWPPFLNSSEYLHFYGCKCRPWPVFLLKSERSHPLFCPGGSVSIQLFFYFCLYQCLVLGTWWWCFQTLLSYLYLVVLGCLCLGKMRATNMTLIASKVIQIHSKVHTNPSAPHPYSSSTSNSHLQQLTTAT